MKCLLNLNTKICWLLALILCSCNSSFEQSDSQSKNLSSKALDVQSNSAVVFSVMQSSDDAEEREDGDMYLNSSDLELVQDYGVQKVGLRFAGVNLPEGAQVQSAYLQFTVDEKSSFETEVQIYAEDSLSAKAFVDTKHNISDRPKTRSSVSWKIAPWSDVGESGVSQRSPNLKDLIVELYGSHSSSGSVDLAFVIEGTGERTAEAFDGDKDKAAKLIIEYKLANSETESPSPTNPETEVPVESNLREYSFSRSIGSSEGDIEEQDDGRMIERSSDLEFSYDKSKKQIVGLRFTEVNIPLGATIIEASIQFAADESSNEAAKYDITIEDDINASAFDTSRYNLSTRQFINKSVAWTPGGWARGDQGQNQQTPNLKSLVQLLVGQGSWKPGNAIVFKIDGVGARTAESYDTNPKLAARLTVKYLAEAMTEPPVIIPPKASVPTPPEESPVINPNPMPRNQSSCLDTHTGPVLELKGEHKSGYENKSGFSSYTRIDATQASFILPEVGTEYADDPFTIYHGDNLCVSGGVYSPNIPRSLTDWEYFHHAQGLYFRHTPNLIVENVAIVASGDGIRFTEETPNWTFRNSYIQHAGDDAIENDFLYSGLVDNVLIDDAFMGFSCRLGSSDRYQGYAKTAGRMTIQNTLVALRPQNAVYKGPAPGHEMFFKWEKYDSQGCKLTLKNNVFLVTQDSNGSPLHLDPSDDDRVNYDVDFQSEGNIIVWTGKGEYPARVPKGFTLTRDIEVWNKARQQWFEANPQFKQYE